MVKCKWCTWASVEWYGPRRIGLEKLRDHVEAAHNSEFSSVQQHLARWDEAKKCQMKDACECLVHKGLKKRVALPVSR